MLAQANPEVVSGSSAFSADAYPSRVPLLRAAAVQIGASLLVLVLAGAGGYVYLQTHQSAKEEVGDVLFAVARGRLTISVTEAGTVKPREQVIIKNEVEGRATILYLIPEGQRVKQGDLLARLDQSIGAQKHFLADAAHQLKTPLAGLRTQAELAARAVQSGQATTAEMTRSLDQIALSSQRAANMVNQLLSLARASGLTSTG